MNMPVSEKYSETLGKMSKYIFVPFINLGCRCFLSLQLILGSLNVFCLYFFFDLQVPAKKYCYFL